MEAGDFNGTQPVIRNVLAAFDAAAAVRWFTALGVALKREETGKLFPATDRAQTVLDALLRRCATLGVDVRAAHRVHDVVPVPTAAAPAASWQIRHDRGVLGARRVVLATGGRSLPRTGSDGGGWTIASRLGHSVTTTVPALVPLVLRPGIHRELTGSSQPVELRTYVDGRLADRRSGSLLWTHVGVSGPVVLDASRHWTLAHQMGRSATLRCGFLPGESFEQVERRLLAAARARPRASIARILGAALAERLGAALARAAGLDPAARLAETPRAGRRALVHRVSDLELPVERDRGWNHAEVTAGGVPLGEIDYRTMESRCRPGLYLIGEILDCDGRIGGFNFQWAWASGFVAGTAAGDALARER